jgi:hypothetical protein
VLTRHEIAEAVRDPAWQTFRTSLHGLSTREKLSLLQDWLDDHPGSRTAVVQVENYQNALRRAGLLPLEGGEHS